MRIIAGEAKGKIIKCRKGMDTRPTLDSVKESLFSMIAPYVPEARVLDLFSGTGNLALESLSRGAKRAVMIEKDTDALKIIIENINNLGYENKSRAYKNDVLRAVDILGRKGEKFDLIFMDPPYRLELCEKVMNKIQENGLLAEGGLIICEHHLFEDLHDEVGEFKKTDERKYGKKCMTFYTR
ncbi:MAG: 16S rRNA (guanine(966)-N(2))-methyltransferase RsmD [Cetobacterium sp.]|uniref:16S rRNA (Guanine(966)-N(2))-methyltransferase RsmD n=1 Tax=Cetobacterium ceti TaxID=180163 RepID=A0A1T4KYU5_9FUSO|nr:16S rRNA (guanine(966)-N(2))-methyltransferase RsmD [Cetobacterium ceti]MCJ8342604.1 16S rRNA (guanine(966)-N(2))-methyltransferase RsmD [Cetobacterium sp.]SJZ47518.1 16S rRNA (guanine(966)-N(2))-methyltransferase RsmD [Cetobacterium ceti]